MRKKVDRDLAKMYNEDAFILPFWNRIFVCLEKISLLSILRKYNKEKKLKQYFVDKYVFTFLIVSILLFVFNYYLQNRYFALFVLIVAFYRIFEIVVYNISVLIFHPYRNYKLGLEYYVVSPLRTLVLLLHNYCELIFWFSSSCISLYIISNHKLISISKYLMDSFYIFVINDRSSIEQLKLPSSVIHLSNFEVIVGFIITIIVLGRVIGMLPSVSKH